MTRNIISYHFVRLYFPQQFFTRCNRSKTMLILAVSLLILIVIGEMTGCEMTMRRNDRIPPGCQRSSRSPAARSVRASNACAYLAASRLAFAVSPLNSVAPTRKKPLAPRVLRLARESERLECDEQAPVGDGKTGEPTNAKKKKLRRVQCQNKTFGRSL